jgi:hypothetical protein
VKAHAFPPRRRHPAAWCPALAGSPSTWATRNSGASSCRPPSSSGGASYTVIESPSAMASLRKEGPAGLAKASHNWSVSQKELFRTQLGKVLDSSQFPVPIQQAVQCVSPLCGEPRNRRPDRFAQRTDSRNRGFRTRSRLRHGPGSGRPLNGRRGPKTPRAILSGSRTRN